MAVHCGVAWVRAKKGVCMPVLTAGALYSCSTVRLQMVEIKSGRMEDRR